MNAEKTGRLICDARKRKDLTQQELADRLNVTNKAVSKWERGLSFPGVDLLENLARELELSVTELLSGELVPAEEAVVQTEKVAVQALKGERKAKKRLLLAGILFVLLLLFAVAYRYAGVIFQRGDPLPYLSAATKIGRDGLIVPVAGKPGVFISKRGEAPAMISLVEELRGVTFVEQAGSGYLFTNGTANLVVSSEIYWKWFTVWSVPMTTLPDE